MHTVGNGRDIVCARGAKHEKKRGRKNLRRAWICVALGPAGNLILPRGAHGQDIVPAEFVSALLCETAETVRSIDRHQGVTFRVFGLTPRTGRGVIPPVSVEEPDDSCPRGYAQEMLPGGRPEDGGDCYSDDDRGGAFSEEDNPSDNTPYEAGFFHVPSGRFWVVVTNRLER